MNMKKNILILSLILSGALGFILVLMGHSGPGALMIDHARRYSGVEVLAEDSIRLTSPLNTMEIGGGFLYGYVAKQKVLLRTNLESRQTDTLLYIPALFSGVLNGIALDPATTTFYFLNGRSDKIYWYHPQDGGKDSFSTRTIHLAGGEKCLTSP